MQNAADPAELQRLEATRYVLLRRLALAMRHQLVVHLQPMGMITDLLERKLQQGGCGPGQLRENLEKVHRLSRSAVEASLDMVTWLAPPPDARISLDEGVRDCLALLGSYLSFRGFSCKDEIGSAPPSVSRAALRHVLTGALLALTDCAASPADVVLTSAPRATGLVALLIEIRPKAGEPGFAGNLPYRLMDWGDVETLARAEGVLVTRHLSGAHLVLPAT